MPLEREKATKSVVMSLFAPAPMGPAAMLASPPSFTEFANSEFSPFSVITRVSVSDSDSPA